MINYEEDWIINLLFRKEGSVAIKAFLFAFPSAIVAVLLLFLEDWQPGVRDDLGLLDLSGSQIYTAATAIVVVLTGFRTRQAFSRFWEGTGLLHQMRGEWFDTVSNCVTFSICGKETKPQQVMEFRHAIVRLMSLCHASALEEIAGNAIQLESIDILGLDKGTLRHLRECHERYHFNKVEVMLHLVQTLIIDAHDKSILKVPPPILSRVYQTISRGFVNLLNAKKITDTKFPFPYVQLITYSYIVLIFLLPTMLTSVIKSKVLAAIFSFVPIFSMWALNFIAQELENPFGTDSNDLPLDHFQMEMNNCLLMLLHYNTDHIVTVSPRCILDFNTLYKQVTMAETGTLGKREFRASQPKSCRISDVKMHESMESEEEEEHEAVQSVCSPRLRSTMCSGQTIASSMPVRPVSACAPAASPSTPSLPAAGVTDTANAKEEQKLSVQVQRSDTVELVVQDEPGMTIPSRTAAGSAATTATAGLANEASTELQFLLAKNMNEFSVALSRWTKQINDQVSDLIQSFDALKHYSDTIPRRWPETSGPTWEGVVGPVT